MHSWLKQRRFAFVLAAGLVVLEAFLYLTISSAAPQGTRWLGDTIYFPGDTAVYLSYIRQIAEGPIFQDNLYAFEPHLLRFNPFWTTLGLVARTGVSPLTVYVAASLILTFLLVVVLFEISLHTTGSTAKARLATTIAVLGGTSGWIYTIYISLFSHWGWRTVVSPDLGSEFSIFTVLFGGPHNILSTTLIMLGLFLIWKGITENTSTKKLILFSSPAAILLSYHPYFAPLFVIFTVLTCFWNRTSWKRDLIKAVVLLALPGIITLAVYLPEMRDGFFVQQHLVTNQQPLAPALSWLFTLALPVVAILWRWRKSIRVTTEERWLMAWLLSAVIFILLPLPWKRKATQGTAVALVFLGLPFWSYLAEKIRKIDIRLVRLQMSAVFWIALALTPLNFITSQMAWVAQASDKHIWFYRSDSIFEAWDHLRAQTAKDGTLVLTDDVWLNLWTPAHAIRRVYVGHDHESPDYAAKMDKWRSFFSSQDEQSIRELLEENPITHLMLSRSSSDALEKTLTTMGWRVVFEQRGTRILQRP